MSNSSPAIVQKDRPWRVAWAPVQRSLQAHGLWTVPERTYSEVEDRLAHTLPTVAVPETFRRSLASNLDLLAEHRKAGVVVHQERARENALLASIGIASLLAAAGLVALLVLLVRSASARSAAS